MLDFYKSVVYLNFTESDKRSERKGKERKIAMDTEIKVVYENRESGSIAVSKRFSDYEGNNRHCEITVSYDADYDVVRVVIAEFAGKFVDGPVEMVFIELAETEKRAALAAFFGNMLPTVETLSKFTETKLDNFIRETEA